jgi:hypothetical protein
MRVDAYFQCMLMHGQTRAGSPVELSAPQGFEQDQSREEILRKMEERTGPAGRKMLGRFLARMDKLERDWNGT